VAWSGAFI